VPRFTLSHNKLDMIGLAAWLDRQQHVLAMPDKIATAVRHCLEEAVINLIDHTAAVVDQTIAIELDWQDDMLVATVEDSGPPFDLRGAPSMVPATDLKTVIPGGWGIHLIRAFASEIEYVTAQGRNRLKLRFAPPASAETQTSTPC
jgi:anti-sigma regulatory factor (Ser/Thr protein kinase)